MQLHKCAAGSRQSFPELALERVAQAAGAPAKPVFSSFPDARLIPHDLRLPATKKYGLISFRTPGISLTLTEGVAAIKNYVYRTEITLEMTPLRDAKGHVTRLNVQERQHRRM